MILQKTANIPTSFATDQKFTLGMLDIAVKRQLENFFVERFLGPRGQFQSIPNGDGTDLTPSFKTCMQHTLPQIN
jgi:hypothetical protein